MFPEPSNSTEKVGEMLGYIIMYLIFTTILFFILKFLNKLPTSWTYLHVMALTLLIVLFGMLIRRILK